jgi:hypothetical protein
MDKPEDPTSKKEQPEQKRQIQRFYANNTYVETSVWDVRLMFGELDRFESGKGTLDWRAAVTMPWAQAKLLCFFLMMNIAIHEQSNGFVRVPDGMIPRVPPPQEDPHDRQINALAVSLYRQLFGADPPPIPSDEGGPLPG